MLEGDCSFLAAAAMTDRPDDVSHKPALTGSSTTDAPPLVSVGWLQRTFVAVLLAVILVEGLPRTCNLHRWIAARLRPLTSPLAIYQAHWHLFAPEPTRSNEHLTAELYLSDGRTVHWRSPEWRKLSRWERFRRSRQISYYNAVLQDARDGASAAIWPAFADYLARQQEAEGGVKVRRVELTSHWIDFATPQEDWRPLGQPVATVHARTFFAKAYP